jgi:adenylosuccinate lyase
MPQKRNPKLSQDIIAMSAELRALVPLALEAMLTEHEADRTTSLMMQHAMEQACALTGDILARLQVMIAGLKINPDRMRRNLDLSGGLIMAEALMLSLGTHIGRQEAHDAVYDAAQEAATSDQSFAELLAQNRTITAHLGAEDIARLLDPTAYLGECAQIASDQAARARIIAAEISETSNISDG